MASNSTIPDCDALIYLPMMTMITTATITKIATKRAPRVSPTLKPIMSPLLLPPSPLLLTELVCKRGAKVRIVEDIRLEVREKYQEAINSISWHALPVPSPCLTGHQNRTENIYR